MNIPRQQARPLGRRRGRRKKAALPAALTAVFALSGCMTSRWSDRPLEPTRLNSAEVAAIPPSPAKPTTAPTTAPMGGPVDPYAPSGYQGKVALTPRPEGIAYPGSVDAIVVSADQAKLVQASGAPRAASNRPQSFALAAVSAITGGKPDANANGSRGAIGGKTDPAVKPTAAQIMENGPVPAPDNIPPPTQGIYALDLSTALRLDERENPTIAISRAGILEALALQTAAQALLAPSLNAGMSYNGHTGNLQRSSGQILSLSKQTLYVGGGARAVTAETVGIPAINIASPLTEALYEPLAARQRVGAAQFNAQATANSVLLEVAQLYLDLLAAEKDLEAQRFSETQLHEVVVMISNFAKTGEGTDADANRAIVDWKLLRARVQGAEGDVAVASARLSQYLNLDPGVRLRPLVGEFAPVSLIDIASPVDGLIQTALRRRPELGARTAEIGIADAKYREERARPLLPTIWMGMSGGGFGGGSNLVPPLLGSFGGRTDFDVRAYWTLNGLGLGNLALIKNRRAQINEAVAFRSRTINRVRDEVTTALSLARARLNQIEVARRELASAEEGYREDYNRARNEKARPIEVLDSLRLLREARVNLIRAINLYNVAQFQLYVSLGSPPPVGPPAVGPQAKPPIANPLRVPLTVDDDDTPPAEFENGGRP